MRKSLRFFAVLSALFLGTMRWTGTASAQTTVSAGETVDDAPASFIINARSSHFASSTKSGDLLTQRTSSCGNDVRWKFVAASTAETLDEGVSAVYIYSVDEGKYLSGNAEYPIDEVSFVDDTADAVVWYIQPYEYTYSGVVIAPEATIADADTKYSAWNDWNGAGEEIGGWQASDIGSIWYVYTVEEVEDLMADASYDDPVEITDYFILDPSFEEKNTSAWGFYGTGRWSDTGYQDNQVASTILDQSIYVEVWKDEALGDCGFNVEQIITLPAGYYRLTAGAQNILESDDAAVQTGVYLFASDTRTEVNLPGTYTVEFTINYDDVDGTQIVIGATSDDVTGNWVAVDNFRLYYLGSLLDTSELEALITTATALYKSGATSGGDSLLVAIEEAEALVSTGVGLQTTLDAAWYALQLAMFNYVVADASYSDPVEITDYFILDPSFEEKNTSAWSISGTGQWSSAGYQSNKDANCTILDQEIYVEVWSSSALGDCGFNVEQTIALPAGYYRLTAGAMNVDQSDYDAVQTGVYLFAGDTQTDVNVRGTYAIEFPVTATGDVTIGATSDNVTGQWVAVDNFQLYYLGGPEVALTAALQSLIAEAKALVEYYTMAADELSVLSAAIATGEAAVETAAEDDVNTAIEALEMAIAAAEVSIDAYNALSDKIGMAQELYGEGGGEGDETTAAAIASALNCLADETATTDEYRAAATDVFAAGLTYAIANVGNDPIDLTDYLIVNPGFEMGSATGWDNDGFSVQSNSDYSGKVGNYYLEKWVSTSNAGTMADATITQAIGDLVVASDFVLSANAQNILQTDTEAEQTGVYLFLDNTEVAVSATTEYSIAFSTTGTDTVTIGFKTVSTTGNWVAVDNFRLLSYGLVTDAKKEALQDLIDEATAAAAVTPQKNSIVAELTEAAGDATALLADSSLTAYQIYLASERISAALDSSEISIEAYEDLATAIEDAEAAIKDEVANGLSEEALEALNEALMVDIAEAKDVYDDLDAEIVAIYDAIDALDQAVNTYTDNYVSDVSSALSADTAAVTVVDGGLVVNSDCLIYSISGQLVKSVKASGTATSVSLPAGVYLVNGQRVMVK